MNIETISIIIAVATSATGGAFVLYKFILEKLTYKAEKRIEIIESLPARTKASVEGTQNVARNTQAAEHAIESHTAWSVENNLFGNDVLSAALSIQLNNLLTEEKFSLAYQCPLTLTEIKVLLRAPSPSKAFNEFVRSKYFLTVSDEYVHRRKHFKKDKRKFLGMHYSLSRYIDFVMSGFFFVASMSLALLSFILFDSFQSAQGTIEKVIPGILVFFISVLAFILFSFSIYFFSLRTTRPDDNLLKEAFGKVYLPVPGTQNDPDSTPQT